MPDIESQRPLQEEIVQWLLASLPGSRRIDTHASHLVLGSEHVFKMKRALDVGWMDFSSLEKRQAACQTELALNRRTAPDLYLAALPVVREGKSFKLGGEGQVVEWLVKMRRFPDGARLDEVLTAGGLTIPLLRRLVDGIQRFQAEAEVVPERGGFSAMLKVVEENRHDLQGMPAETVMRLYDETARQLRANETLLEARRRQGSVRRCHGDLHLANIALIEGQPVLFDCIEFSESIGTIDVLYDFAFLLMDLDYRARRDLANTAMNRFFEVEDPQALCLLPAFLSLRAGVRAKVAWLGGDGTTAARYLNKATDYLAPPPPRLIAVGGYSGSGKSSLAQHLAPLFGAAPGAFLVRSDVTRKRLFGVMPEEPLPLEAYSPEWHAKVAEVMLLRAESALKAGHSVLLDAVHGFAPQRAATAALAQKLGIPFQGLWLQAPPEVLHQRVSTREREASDATAAVVEKQIQAGAPVTDWPNLDSSGSFDETLAAARRLLAL